LELEMILGLKMKNSWCIGAHLDHYTPNWQTVGRRMTNAMW
jgi:hypothetical protein